ncbi:MAG: VanZ family protein [Flavobacteriales bacterium]|nr:VanZ family protein [Flavobacteriales bacterium]
MRYSKLILAVCWTAFIVYALTKEPSSLPRYKWLAIEGVDKVIHAILFAIEAWLVAWAFGRDRNWRPILWVLLFCTVLGGGLEWVQHQFIEGRTGDVWDLLADSVGAVLGVMAFQKMMVKT